MMVHLVWCAWLRPGGGKHVQQKKRKIKKKQWWYTSGTIIDPRCLLLTYISQVSYQSKIFYDYLFLYAHMYHFRDKKLHKNMLSFGIRWNILKLNTWRPPKGHRIFFNETIDCFFKLCSDLSLIRITDVVLTKYCTYRFTHISTSI